MEESTNVCSLKPDDYELSEEATDWIINKEKLCKTVNRTKDYGVDDFLIYGK